MGRVEIIHLVHGWGTVPADGSSGLTVHTSLLSALQTRAERNDGMSPPYDYWLIDDSKVAEPHAGGRIIGTTADISVVDKKVLRMSQLSYDHVTDPNTPTKPISFTR